MNKIKIKVCLFIINNFLSITRFWNLKRKLLQFAGVSIGTNSFVVGPIKFNTATKLNIGSNTWIGRNLCIEGNGEVNIGDYCDFGPSVTLLTGTHEIGDSQRRAGKGLVGHISVGNGVWIGANSILLPNIVVEDSSVIGAGAVVSKNVEKNVIVAGVPAKIIRYL